MVELIEYTGDFKQETVIRIAKFFGFHAGLITGNFELTENDFIDAEKTLDNWISSKHQLYMIKYEESVVGFLHICYRGDIVAWIEDIYVDESYRNRGIATEAIKIAEDIIKSNPNYEAVCFDVVPRNEEALRLYHKLGYDSLSLITVRKELYDNKRDKIENFLGYDFKV